LPVILLLLLRVYQCPILTDKQDLNDLNFLQSVHPQVIYPAEFHKPILLPLFCLGHKEQVQYQQTVILLQLIPVLYSFQGCEYQREQTVVLYILEYPVIPDLSDRPRSKSCTVIVFICDHLSENAIHRRKFVL